MSASLNEPDPDPRSGTTVPFAHSAQDTAATRPPQDAGLPCVFCGYDLRHLDVAGACPECGRPIARSLRGSELAASDPRWIARLCGGVAAFLIALPVIWLPLAWPVLWWGVWRMTTPEPRRGHTPGTLLLRWVLVALIFVIPVVLMYTAGRDPGALLLVMVGGAAVLLACGDVAASRLLRRVAVRGLKRLMRIVNWCWYGGLFGSVALYGIDAVQSLAAGDRLPVPTGHLVPVALGAILALLLLPVLLLWLWKTLDAAQFQATADTPRLMAFVWSRQAVPGTAST